MAKAHPPYGDTYRDHVPVIVTTGDICAHCREHLALYKVPAAIEFRHELPKTLLRAFAAAGQRRG
jgi:hypothetical protein